MKWRRCICAIPRSRRDCRRRIPTNALGQVAVHGGAKLEEGQALTKDDVVDPREVAALRSSLRGFSQTRGDGQDDLIFRKRALAELGI